MNIFNQTIATSVMFCLSTVALCQSTTLVPTVGIVVPLEHVAMTEIIRGFKRELAQKYHHDVKIEVKNAEHDLMVERSIINQFKEEGVTVVAPIGTDAFDMALATINHRAVLGIAADYPTKTRQARTQHNATNVDDELSSQTQLQFVSQACPRIKTLTLIHSTDAKMFAEVKAFKKAASNLHIAVQDLTVQQPSDLYTLTQHVSPSSQALFLLKDHLVVSGIATLVKQAVQRHIPVIASDDGSVQSGAAFALGVRESDIGKMSADVMAKILQGESPGTIPTRYIKHYHVFINLAQAQRQGVNVTALQHLAKRRHYSVVYLSNKLRG